MTQTRLPRVCLFFGSLSLALAARAQTTLTAPATPPAKADDTISLSEFQVSEKSSNGYIASETMTGSRVNTKIIDLPYSIVNLTSEFFNDFAIDVLDENMTYIGGLTGINIGGSFNLRGVAATSQLRDGFYRLGRYGLSNIDRVEVIRGPNAAIYGRSSPGGMINFIGLQPKKTDEQSIAFREGSYKQNKEDLQMTGSIDAAAKTYYVLKLDQNSRAFPGQYTEIRNNEGYAAVEHDFSSTSHFKVSAEYYLQTQHAAQQGAPIVSAARLATPDNSATTTVVGYDAALASFSPLGPKSELNRGSDTFQAIYDNEFNDVWSTRVGAYNFRARRWDFNNNGWGAITVPLSGAAPTSTRGSVPSRGEIMEDGGGFQADLVAHYFLLNHQVEAKTLLTVDLNDYYRWDPTWNMLATDPSVVAWGAATSGRVVTLVPGSYNGRMDYLPSAPLTYFSGQYDPGAANPLSTLTRRRTTSLGGNLRQQMFFFDKRLIAYAGIRNDNVLFSERDYTVQFASVGFGSTFPPGQGGAGQPGGSVLRRYVHQNKPNAGFNYAVTPNFRFYGSFSEAYFVDQTSRPVVIAASTYAPFTSKGWDYGIKGSFLDQKLNFTLGGYYLQQFNVVVNDEVETFPGSGIFASVSRQDGNQLIRGWESDLSWTVTNDLTVGGSFGRVDSQYTFFGSAAPEAPGRSVNGITPENGGAYIKYAPRAGRLNGLSFNLQTTYVSSTPTQTPVAGDTVLVVNGVPTVTGHTDAWKLRLPSFQLWEFGVHYQYRMNAKWNQEISLNVKNIFDKRYLKTSALAGDHRGILLTYQLTHSSYSFH